MPAPPTISKPPSLPSLSSSNITHSHSARTHFTAPSNTRAVVTAPPWAQDEPPSPTDHDEIDRLGHRSIVITQPSDLASSLRSSFDALTRESDNHNRSRWWTFVRPRERSGKYDWRGLDTMDHNRPSTDDRQSRYLVSSRERPSDESPAPRSTDPSPAPFGPARSKTLGRDSPRRGRTELRDGVRGHYAHMDIECGEKSSVARSRKNRFRAFILSNIYVPLVRPCPFLFQLGP
jgi:hypothetical protein